MRFLVAFLVYIVVTVVLFDDPLKPIVLATLWNDRLGAPYWRGMAVLTITASALIFARPFRRLVADVYKLPVFVFLAIVLPTVTVGLYADLIRRRAIDAFNADEVDQQSFFKSIRVGPKDYQFDTHTAVLKNCTSYI